MIKSKISQRKGLPGLCLMIAFFMFSLNLSAQQFPDLVPDETAKVMLSNELPSLIAIMDGLTPGGQAHTLAERTFQMYQHTWEYLENGESLVGGLQDAYREFATNIDSEGEIPDLSKTGYVYDDLAFDSLVNFLSQ